MYENTYTHFKQDLSEIQRQMKEEYLILSSKRKEKFSIFSVSISRMEEKVRRHGKEKSSFIMSLQNAWMSFVHSDIMYFGEEISIVPIMRSISLVQRKMMEKSDFIQSNVHGSMGESKMVGVTSGERRIRA